MKTLRLLVTKKCDKGCEGCCNKDWNLDNLPTPTHYEYDQILITGGEPLGGDLRVEETITIINGIKLLHPYPDRKIFVYTSVSNQPRILNYCDGITLSIHTQKDLVSFLCWKEELEKHKNKSMRLNIFKGVVLPNDIDLSCWVVKYNIEWVINCPLPQNEVFMKLKNV